MPSKTLNQTKQTSGTQAKINTSNVTVTSDKTFNARITDSQ